jgi:hypothetical protein
MNKNIENWFGSMTGADRQRWLLKTEQQISDSKAWLARCRREGLSTYSAEITLSACMERKAALLKGGNPTVVAHVVTERSSTAQTTVERAEAWAQGERQRWQERVLAEARRRAERDARLRAQQWWPI